MSEILLYYKRPDPTTWVYMSSFLTIGLYFVFHRFWSVRNLDIVLLILLAPGLLVVYEGRRREIRQTELLAQRETQLRQERQSTQTMTSVMGVVPIFALTSDADDSRTVEADSFQNPSLDDGDANAAPQDVPSPGSSSEEPKTDFVGQANSAVSVSDPSTAIDISPPDSDAVSNRSVVDVDPDDPVFAPDGLDNWENLESGDGSYAPADVQRWGFIYLFIVEAMVLLRLMLDPLMDRRPLLDPNLTTGGLNFIGISLFIFMMANVINSSPRIQEEQGPKLGPGYALMNMLPAIPTRPVSESIGGEPERMSEPGQAEQTGLSRVAKTLAILAQLSVVAAIVLIGNRHFSNLRGGVGCATLYLMLPYTAQMTGRVDHVLPAALLLWAVLCHRRPMVAGIFIGLAGGLLYYPLFLLPLWFSFYWQRGSRDFAIGVASMLVLLMIGLSFDDTASLWEHLRRMFGILNPQRDANQMEGIWALGWNPIWRLPVIVAFVILSVFFAIWPAQKNLGTLMSGTAAIMVGAQFWHGYFGGLYLAWFLPLLLLTIFRPNLQDRTASKVVIDRNPRSRRKSSELRPV